jgi:hypothetical protein
MDQVTIVYEIVPDAGTGRILAIGTQEEVNDWVVKNCADKSFTVVRYKVGDAPPG